MTDQSLPNPDPRGNTTFFSPTPFFPNDVKKDIQKFLTFINQVNTLSHGKVPAAKKEFQQLVKEYQRALKGKTIENSVVMEFVTLQQTYDFSQEWVDTFLASQARNFQSQYCEKLCDTREYLYGSAEVVGLMMTNILRLPKDCHAPAQNLSRAAGYLHCLQHISQEEQSPQIVAHSLLQRYGLSSLHSLETEKEKKAFRKLIRAEVDRSKKWLDQARKSFRYFPRRYRVSVRTTADLADWTAKKIAKNPENILKKKIAPSTFRRAVYTFKNVLLFLK